MALRLPSGAALVVSPEQYEVTRNVISAEPLRPYHVVVCETLLPLVLEVVGAMPCRANVRVQEGRVLAYVPDASDQISMPVVVERTFLNEIRRMRDANSVVQSTGEAHGVF